MNIKVLGEDHEVVNSEVGSYNQSSPYDSRYITNPFRTSSSLQQPKLYDNSDIKLAEKNPLDSLDFNMYVIPIEADKEQQYRAINSIKVV